MPFNHIRSEGKARRMGARLLAVVAEGKRGRVYLDPTDEMEAVAHAGKAHWLPETSLPDQALSFRVQLYGMTKHADLFTERQLVGLGTFSDLVSEAREMALADAIAAGMEAGAQTYADAVATYLALAMDRAADRGSTICTWDSSIKFEGLRNAFARQALPMTWDFAEGNPFSKSSGNWISCVDWVCKVLDGSPHVVPPADVRQRDAATPAAVDGVVTATDPPYYDNIGYADLSDFFYVWLRRSLRDVHPELFRTLLTPKASELVATPYRFGGDRERARRFFETGLGRAISQMRSSQPPDFPMTLFYAYKQSDTGPDTGGNGATASTGWETMLAGVVSSGFAVCGTWPVRSELGNRMVASGTHALASSIVLACRPRPTAAPLATRRDFTSALRAELPQAIRQMQAGNIAPVDLAQAAIGPGMGIFSRYAQVLEGDGKPMSVRAALVEINWVLDETLAESDGVMDSDTRFCVAWFEQYGTADRAYGEAEVLFTAKNTSFDRLNKAGVILAGERERERHPLLVECASSGVTNSIRNGTRPQLTGLPIGSVSNS